MKFRLLPILLLLMASCQEPPPPSTITRSMEVTASAYTSSRWETQGDPFQTAFGDTLRPGMRAIAVSRDLLDSGLIHNTEVWIEDLGGPYCVMDKMNRRWRRHIDIYMGNNRDSALEWGRRKVTITWEEPVRKKPEE